MIYLKTEIFFSIFKEQKGSVLVSFVPVHTEKTMEIQHLLKGIRT